MLFNILINAIEQDDSNKDEFKALFQEMDITAKTTLLKEGEISSYMYFIKKGCLRLWFNNDGKDVTFQFFFENQAVSSFESFLGRQPSIVNLESIEPTSLVRLGRHDFEMLINHYPGLKDHLMEILILRMAHFAKLFLSRIKDNPSKRYKDLLEKNPEIFQRIPQHYIASYLGITPISLSRIRNKK